MPPKANRQPVSCACGCGQLITPRIVHGKMTRFVQRHHTKGALSVRFWDRVDRSGDCWIWQGCRNPKGYGHIRITVSVGVNKAVLTHRLAYELTYGPIPDGHCVCHHCDNPPCCRPDHLFLGTVAENQLDMAAKERSPNGEGHYLSKLTETDVIAIRALYSSGTTQAKLAKQFNIHQSSIHHIVNRSTWKNVA